jgi:hypothetical protein
MNLTRLALAAVAATLVDALYGFLVYGTLMAARFARFPAVFRSADSGAAYLPPMFACIFVGMIAAVCIYARGDERFAGRGGLQEGMRFGLLLALLNAGYVIGTDYGILNISGGLAASMAVAGLGEWLLVGTTIGLVYKRAGV